MIESAEEKLDRVTDSIVGMVDDWFHQKGSWDVGTAATHIRRMLQAECPELWEESALQADIDRLREQLAAKDSEIGKLASHRDAMVEMITDAWVAKNVADWIPDFLVMALTRQDLKKTTAEKAR